MDSFAAQLQFVERSGNTLSIEEKMKITLAVKELSLDLGLVSVALVAKVSGKSFL